jgi:hypothetical protein
MPAGVVADCGLLVLGEGLEVREDGFDVMVGKRRAGECGIRVVDVGLVMQVVMDPHRLRVDMGLERVVRIGKVRKFERHGSAPFASTVRICSRRLTTRRERSPVVARLQLRGDRAA